MSKNSKAIIFLPVGCEVSLPYKNRLVKATKKLLKQQGILCVPEEMPELFCHRCKSSLVACVL